MKPNYIKNLIKFSITLTTLILGIILFLQTPFAKQKVKEILIQTAHNQGITISIDRLGGYIPFEWTLSHVHLSGKMMGKEPLYFDTLKVRFAILPLFKKRLEISYLKAIDSTYGSIAFEATANVRIDLEGKKPIKISHFLLEGDDFYFHINGSINPDFTIQKGNINFCFYQPPFLQSFAPQGTIRGTALITNDTAKVDCFSDQLTLSSISLDHCSLTLEARYSATGWKGTGKFLGGPTYLPLDATFGFLFSVEHKLVSIEDFRLQGPETSLVGKLDFDSRLQCMEGTLFAQCMDLSVLRPLLPNSYLKGRLGGKLDFKSFSQFQDLVCQIELEEFGAYQTTGKTLSIQTTLYDLFGELRGELSVEGNTLSFPQAHLSLIELKSTFEPGHSPFMFSLQGECKDPLELSGQGFLLKKEKGISIKMQDLDGYAFKKPFSLQEPFSLEWGEGYFKLDDFFLKIGDSNLSSRIDLSKTSSTIKIKGNDFPLEFIPLPHQHFSLKGTSSFDIDLHSFEDKIQGNCNLTLNRAFFLSEGTLAPLTTKGSLQIHLNGDRAQIHAELKAKEEQFLQFFASLPLQAQSYPFQVTIPHDQPIAGEILGEGKLEELFNFINIGVHRLEGWVSTHLYFSNTLKKPYLQGELQWQDGQYENYYSGTYLTHIEAIAKAKDQTIQITQLDACDDADGSVQATGSLLLSPEHKFPFSIQANLSQLNTLSFDTITGKFSGAVTISGNRGGATAKGKLKVDVATFRIPDQLPSALPELEITFVNPPDRISRKKISSPALSPLLLDLDIDVPGKAYVEGRGLHSELKGKLHITGTYIDIVANGKLQLVTGEYIFSGKVFTLTQGEMIFTDKPNPSAYISLSGTCNLPDVSVVAILRGPFSAPKLTFQSSPQLPTSSLLARILFNKDISEISAVQALQLAQTVVSLSGNSAPDILEKIRKSLGIDRLTLITSENDPGKISLQVGKYLMRGVLLTLSQGAESRNVTVEVELKKGIFLQAEVNENQQGKFSIKWHYNY